jgi:hypothetical protein
MTQHAHPFTDAPLDTPLVYYRPGWASRLPCVIREINGELVLLTTDGGRLDALAALPADAVIEEGAV